MNILMLGSGSYKSSLTYRIVALGEKLSQQGHGVSLVVPSADKYNDFKPDRNPQLRGVRVRQPWQFTTRSAMLNLLPYLLTSLATVMTARADLVYLYKPTPITITGLVRKLLLRTPVVLDLDDLGSEVMRAQGQSGLQAKLVAWCERLALRHADAVVVASTYLAGIVADQYPDKPLLVLSNGVDVNDYPAVTAARPRRAVYYFGALNRLSLIEDVLRAMPATIKAVPGTTLYLLGGGSALDEAKALAVKLGIADSVVFSGWIDMFAASRYARFADPAVCYQPDTPTVRAASNMKVFQYMAMGLVPVVSKVGDLPRYVQPDAGVAVRAGSPRSLATALISLLKDAPRRRALAQAARLHAETDRSWTQLADRLGDFLQGQVTQLAPKRLAEKQA